MLLLVILKINLCFSDNLWNVFAVVDGTTPLGIPLIPVRVMGL